MRLLAIAWKEMRHLRRDRITLAMVLLLPTLQFLLFGFAINTDARHLPLAVLDRDRSAASRDLAGRLEATTYFDRAGEVETYEEASRVMLAGRASAVLVVPADFAEKRTEGKGAVAQLLIDGSDPLTVGSAAAAAAGLFDSLSVEEFSARGRVAPPLRAVLDLRYNPEQRTAIYIVPGLIGVILTFTLVLMTSFAIARERERGTIEALLVSPVRRWEIIIGKLAPFVVIGYIQMTLVLLLGWVLFDIRPGPGVGLLYAVAALFIAANLAVGLVFSSLVATQGQAMQLSFFFLLPNVLLSGFMFPIQAMPAAIRWLPEILPLTHFLRLVRGIVLKGAELRHLLPDIACLAGLLVFLLLVAISSFRKKI